MFTLGGRGMTASAIARVCVNVWGKRHAIAGLIKAVNTYALRKVQSVKATKTVTSRWTPPPRRMMDGGSSVTRHSRDSRLASDREDSTQLRGFPLFSTVSQYKMSNKTLQKLGPTP